MIANHLNFAYYLNCIRLDCALAMDTTLALEALFLSS